MKKQPHPFIAVLIPPFLGLVCSLALFLCKVPSLIFTRIEFLLNTIISCSATISGFILASVTILVGATSSEIMKEIKKHGAHKELRWRYTEALVLGLIVIFFFAVLGAIIDETNLVSHVQVSISAGILVSYTCSVVSTCYYLLSIIGLINEDKKGPDNTPSTPAGKFR
jgi:hypothetical protein